MGGRMNDFFRKHCHFSSFFSVSFLDFPLNFCIYLAPLFFFAFVQTLHQTLVLLSPILIFEFNALSVASILSQQHVSKEKIFLVRRESSGDPQITCHHYLENVLPTSGPWEYSVKYNVLVVYKQIP